MFCGHCGKQIENDVKYCPYCGMPVERRKQIKHGTAVSKNKGKVRRSWLLGIFCAVLVLSVYMIVCSWAKRDLRFSTSNLQQMTEGKESNEEEEMKTSTTEEETETVAATEWMAEDEAEMTVSASEVLEETEQDLDVQTDTDNVSAIRLQYARIVELYSDVFETVKNDEKFWEYEDITEIYPEYGDVNIEYIYECNYEGNYPAFILYDLNGDGTSELFVGLGSEAGRMSAVYDVYTFQDGRLVQLMAGIGYRAGSCIFCEGGIIKDVSSGSAFSYTVAFHTLPVNGMKLETIEKVSMKGDQNYTGFYREVDNYQIVEWPDNEITEEEFESTQNKYFEIQMECYRSNTENIQKLKRGEIQENRAISN